MNCPFNEAKYKALLEGLEVRETFFSKTISNKDFRIDSQFYTKEPIKNPALTYEKIGNLLVNAQYGISISMNEDGDGYPIYRMNEIHNMLCDIDVSKYAKITNEELLTFKLNDREVLFNRTNSFEWVGRTGLYRKIDDKDFVFASYLVRFIPNEDKLLPEYLTAFLNTKYGIWDIKRRSRQSINQTNVNPEEVKAIEIPLLSKEFQDLIKDNFDVAHENRILSRNKYTQAEQILLEELGLKDFEPSNEPVNIKSFKDSFLATGRLDAEYYQKKYEDIEKAIKSYKNGWSVLDEFIGNYSTGFPYKSETYVDEKGIPLIRINNIKNGYLDLENSAKIPESDLSLSPKDIAKENDILISMSGTIGNSCKIPKGVTAVINQRIMRITPKNYNVDVLPLLINSIIGKFQLERIGTGGVQTNISSSDIRKILIPIIPNDKQQKIADLVEESFALKKQSEELLETAKRAVEIAIEQSEEKAIEFIENIVNLP